MSSLCIALFLQLYFYSILAHPRSEPHSRAITLHDHNRKQTRNVVPDRPSEPPWTNQMTIALIFVLFFSGAFAAFAFAPVVRRKFVIYRAKWTERIQDTPQRTQNDIETDFSGDNRSTIIRNSSQSRGYGYGYDGITTPQLRSSTRTRDEGDDGDDRSSRTELESMVAARLPEQPPSIMLKEIIPLPPIEL